MRTEVRHIIVTMHGIRTGADHWGHLYRAWTVAQGLAPRVAVEPYWWGQMMGWQMYASQIVPFWERSRQNEAAEFLGRIRDHYPFAQLSILAHSKGTDLAVDTLARFPDIRVNALVLVGSVLPVKYTHTKLPRLFARGQITRCLNVWSPTDMTIELLSWPPFGKAGSRGFIGGEDEPGLDQCRTEEAHATYFWSEFRHEHFARWTQVVLNGEAA